MADPNEYGEEHQMMGSFVEEGQEYESGLGSDFSEDIKATAHFTQAQMNNINRQNNFVENLETSPIARFQMPQSNQNFNSNVHQYSLHDSGRGNSQLQASTGSMNRKQQSSQGYRKAQSLESSEGNQAIEALEQNELQRINSQESPQLFSKKGTLQSSGSKNGSPQMEQMAKLQSQVSQQSNVSQKSQQSEAQQIIKLQSQQSGTMQKVVQNPSNPSQESPSIGQNAVSSSQETGQATNGYPGSQRTVQPPATLFHSQPIEATQQRVQQISRQQTFGHLNNERTANGQQAGLFPAAEVPSRTQTLSESFRQSSQNTQSNPNILGSQNIQSSQGLQSQGQQAQQGQQVQQAPQSQSQPQNINFQSSTLAQNMISSPVHTQATVQGLTSPSGSSNPAYLNRYFSSAQANGLKSSNVPQVQGPVLAQNQSINQQRSQVGQIGQTRTSFNQGGPQIESRTVHQAQPPQFNFPTSPQFQQQKPQSVGFPSVNQRASFQQSLRSTIDRPQGQQGIISRPSGQNIVNPNPISPPSSSREPSPSIIHHNSFTQLPAPGRQSRLMLNEQSNVVPGSRRSVSYGSNDSKSKPPVFFTYANNVVVGPVRVPNQNQVQIIREHTHTNTIIQKTTTIVWEHRYFTVIQKFNFVSQRFDTLLREFRLITQILEGARDKADFERLYRDLMMRHTALLELLQETQHEIANFQEENASYKKEIQYETEMKEQSLYKDKCRTLEQQNIRLKQEINRLSEQLKQLNLKLSQAQSQSQQAQQVQPAQRPQSNNQAQIKQFEIKILKMQEELIKSQAFSNELQQYIGKLQSDNNMLALEVEKLRSGESNSTQYVHLIKNQETIIRELEKELKKTQAIVQEQQRRIEAGQSNQGQGQNQTQNQNQNEIQQYIKAISQLQAKINSLEQNQGQNHAQYSERKYTEIIDNQRNIIENIDQHFKQFERSAAMREDQLKNLLQNQENIINTLEEQLKKFKRDDGGVSREREQTLLQQIQEAKGKIQGLQFDIQKLQEKLNGQKDELASRVAQITTLKEERTTYQRSMEIKLEQKLIQIEQQLKQRSTEVQRPQPAQPSPSTPKAVDTRQLQQLTEENERLSAEIRKRQQQKRKLQEERITEDENMRRKLMEKESEMRLLNDKIKMFEEENKRRFSDKDRRIKSLEDEVEALTNKARSNVSTPRNNQSAQNFDNYSPSNTNNQQIRSLKDKLNQKDQELFEVQRQKQNAEKRLQALQINFNSIDEENSKRTQEFMNLKRQLSNFGTFENEIKTLTETVNKKNQEILELKSIAFEKNELKIQFEAIKNERNTLKSTIQAKIQQIDKLKQTIAQLESKMRQNKNRQSLFPVTTNESAVEELQVMYESMKKKEAELIKIKQANQLLETNVQELQYQLERTKGKVGVLEKASSHDKQDYTSKIAEYQNKIRELEARTKSLDESQRNHKTNFNTELQNMDNTLKEKEEVIRKLEGQNKVLKNKLKNHDSKIQEYDSEIDALNRRIKELQTTRDELKKQIETLETGGQNNNKKLYDEYQIKIVELEAIIKVKDNKIKQLENNFETLKIKAAHNPSQDDFINQQQIEVLRKKIAEYETRLYSGSRINTFKPRDYESTLIFEQRAIYDLKAENERLKSMLSGKGMKYSPQEISPQKPNLDFIQKRLLDFNHRLEEMIEENRTLEQKNVDFSSFLEPRQQNQQLLISFERERGNLLRRHRTEISALQARMVDLQRYCSTLQSIPNNNISTYTYASNTKYLDSAKGIYSQQLTYYKDKNKELEERIDSHIKINKELKDKLEGMLKSSGDPNAIQYYRMQISQMEKEASEYLAKIKSLTEEISRLRLSLESHKNDQSSEIKIHDLENKIHELNRKISQLQMQNGILQSDLLKYSQELKNANDEAHKHKSGGHQKDQKLSSQEQSLRQANIKINGYELQMVKLSNQIKLLEAELERLNEKIQSKQEDESAEISRLKSRIVQLQAEVRNYQELSNNWTEAKNSYELTISTLNGRIANLEGEMSRLNALYINLSKKAKDNDGEIFDLENKWKMENNRANDLEDHLKHKELEIESMQQFLQRLRKQRDNEGSQSKQRLAYIAEMEETIRSLRSQVSQYKSELERLRTESSENRQRLSSMSSMEEVIKELRLQITLHKGQIQRLKSTNEQLRQRASMISQYEQTIEELRVEIARYKSELERMRRDKEQESGQNSQSRAYILQLEQTIKKLRIDIESYKSQNLKSSIEVQRLRKQIQRLEQEINKLRIHIGDIEREMQLNQEVIDGIAYRLEFIRSTFIEIEVLQGELMVDKANRRQVELVERVRVSVAGGLRTCSETFAML